MNILPHLALWVELLLTKIIRVLVLFVYSDGEIKRTCLYKTLQQYYCTEYLFGLVLSACKDYVKVLLEFLSSATGVTRAVPLLRLYHRPNNLGKGPKTALLVKSLKLSQPTIH